MKKKKALVGGSLASFSFFAGFLLVASFLSASQNAFKHRKTDRERIVLINENKGLLKENETMTSRSK